MDPLFIGAGELLGRNVVLFEAIKLYLEFLVVLVLSFAHDASILELDRHV